MKSILSMVAAGIALTVIGCGGTTSTPDTGFVPDGGGGFDVRRDTTPPRDVNNRDVQADRNTPPQDMPQPPNDMPQPPNDMPQPDMPPGNCTAIQATGFMFAGIGAYTSSVSPALGGADEDLLILQFFDGATGSFDLSQNGDDQFASCNRCLLVGEDLPADPQLPPGRVYMAQSGTLDIDPTSTPLDRGAISATLTNVTLVEISINEQGVSTPVPNGQCLTIANATVMFEGLPEPPMTWTCDPSFYAAMDGCDCGCGAPDPDCADAMLGTCEFCWCDQGEFSDCATTVDPNDTTACLPPP